jgi:TIR domain
MNHKVFISHASEDKKRFVLGFATKLREAGLDAWVDIWEIAPGDSVVRRIFEEGLGKADAVIIVLSAFSADKPWVRAELDVAKVRQIEERTRIIPIVLEDCEVPTSLIATKWVRIKNLEDYEAELRSIVMAIHGMHDKPPLGASPAYSTVPIVPIRNLPQVSSLALKLCYESLMERYPGSGESEEIIKQLGAVNVPRQEAVDALDILHRRHYIKGAWTMGVDIFRSFYFTDYGIQIYVNAHIPNYTTIARDVVVQIVNHSASRSEAIANTLSTPHFLIVHILKRLKGQGYLKYAEVVGGMLDVWDCSPELKYLLQDGNWAA